MGYKTSIIAVVACALLACVAGGNPSDPIPIPTLPPAPTTPPTPAPTTPPTPPTTPPTPAPTTPPTPPPTTPPTPAPTTPPTPAPTTPPTPAPAPSDERGNWTVSGDNVTCILAAMSVSAKISYPLEGVNKTSMAEIRVPVKATAAGSCDNSTQNIAISWEKNSLEFNFEKNDTTKSYALTHIVLTVVADEKNFPNISSELLNQQMVLERKENTDVKVPLGQSFRCTREQSLPLSHSKLNSTQAVLVVDKVQLQAFHETKSAVFGAAQDCELDTPDIVPIAVGCALALLVCVVLVAYLVGRRRSQARGYLSM